MFKNILVALVATSGLAACATTPKTFYANPSKVSDTTLCRTIVDAAEKGDQKFAGDTAAEAVRRGLTAQSCQHNIDMQNAAIIGIAAVATGVAVVAACSNGCSPGYSRQYASPAVDYDCAGGGGNGSLYVYHPVYVGNYDPYGLDADHDGTGCELSDISRGS